MIFEHDAESNRARLLGDLMLRDLDRPGSWHRVRSILGPLTTGGPWAADLEDLVERGDVECSDRALGADSRVRIRQSAQ